MSMRRAVMIWSLALVPAALAAQGAGAPTGRCTLQFTADHALNSYKLPSGQYNIFTGGHVVARCPAQGLVLRSDSLESYGDEGRILSSNQAALSRNQLLVSVNASTAGTRQTTIHGRGRDRPDRCWRRASRIEAATAAVPASDCWLVAVINNTQSGS